MVDLATLTGAARVGAGHHPRRLFATDDGLADSLTAAGRASGEQVWRMPLEEGYVPTLASDVADLWHIVPGRDGCQARSSPRCSCASRPAGGRGPTWTSPGPGPVNRRANGELAGGDRASGVRLLLGELLEAHLLVEAHDRGQQAVADRQQQRHQALVGAAGLLAQLAGTRRDRRGRAQETSTSSKARIPPGRSSRSAAVW